jgi:hypothetical protein
VNLKNNRSFDHLLTNRLKRYQKGYSGGIQRRRTDDTITKRKRTNNAPQNTKQKIKDKATQTLLKTGCELGCSRRENSPCCTNGTRRITLIKHSVISHVRKQNKSRWDCDYEKPNVFLVICDR